MRKAHEAEVQKEVTKFKTEFLKKIQSNHDIGALHKEHECVIKEHENLPWEKLWYLLMIVRFEFQSRNGRDQKRNSLVVRKVFDQVRRVGEPGRRTEIGKLATGTSPAADHTIGFQVCRSRQIL